MAPQQSPACEGAQLYVALFFLLRHELALEERLSVEDKQAGRIARAVDLPMFCHSLLLEFPVSQPRDSGPFHFGGG